MRVLVTGGSGFLGTHVLKFFGADDFSRSAGLDILNLQDVQKVQDYDVVIHLAAHLDKSADSDETTYLTNVEGTINILREISPNTAFIFASTKDVYGRFADNYREVPETCPTVYSGQSALEWSKLIAERYVEYYAAKRNFRSCIFRLSNIYAPISENTQPNFVAYYAEAIKNGATLKLPANGAPRRDFLHVEDFARACRAFVDSVIGHGIYNLGGGRENALTLSELVKKMEEISGSQAVMDLKNSPPAPVPMNYVSDLNLVRQELDWQPEINLDEGLKTLFS